MMHVTVNLSAPIHHERSGMSKALHNLYYGRDTLLSMITHNGYPHHGGEHALTISGGRVDVVAWLELFGEQYPDCAPEVAILKHRIRTHFVQNPTDPRFRLELRKIERQLPYNGELVMKPWFWTPAWEEEQ